MPRIDFKLKTSAHPTGVSVAPIDSPTFSGSPALPSNTTAVTQTAGDDTTKIATTKFVTTALSGIQQNSISQGNSNITVTDTGTGSIGVTVDGSSIVTINSSGTSTGQPVSITNNTASNSSSTGSLIVTGGVGVGGKINAGNTIAGTTIEATTGDVLISRTNNEYGYIVRPNTTGAKKLQFAVAGGTALDEARLNAASTYMTGTATVASTLRVLDQTAISNRLRVYNANGGEWAYLGSVNSNGSNYIHVKTSLTYNDYKMTMFRITGFFPYSAYAESYMGCYTYGATPGSPYGQINANQGNHAAAYSQYYSSDAHWVLVIAWGTSYTGANIEYISTGAGYGSVINVSILSFAGSNSTSGVY
jgi:hypothetical protein